MSGDADPKGALRAAEIAVADGEFEVAEDAALEALSRIRYQQSEGDAE
jgi:tellurite resistance protein